MDTLPPADELAELAITSYLAYFVKKEKVNLLYFLLVQYAAKSCSISKSFGDVTRLLAVSKS